MQLNQFWRETQYLRSSSDQRYKTLLSLLESDEKFRAMQTQIPNDPEPKQFLFGLPIPFFRRDGTLLWMMELSTEIPQTPGYKLISWMPLNEDSSEYAAEIRRMADESSHYSKSAYFLEDFKHFFSPVQQDALGLKET